MCIVDAMLLVVEMWRSRKYRLWSVACDVDLIVDDLALITSYV